MMGVLLMGDGDGGDVWRGVCGFGGRKGWSG